MWVSWENYLKGNWQLVCIFIALISSLSLTGTWALCLEFQQPFCVFGMTMRKGFLDLFYFLESPTIPPVNCCASYLLLHNKLPPIYELKTTLVYYLIISLHHESRPGLGGSFAQGLTRLQSRCQPGCILIRRLDWGKNRLPNTLRLLAGFIS